ncbi:hypothetical protein A4A49_40764 [Nicotiana attenuata]|uniref:Uncharacterized protein n=1 Tax=Nicotiana attenuata TaxID=49451 RepID=A0A1J6KJZ4_NICAT|nr:hypothetical protein A4A49_40764 [Nicotiana attenuata]
MWLLLNNKLPTAKNLFHRNIIASTTCASCPNTTETLSHLFINCPQARSIWEHFNFHIPANQMDSQIFQLCSASTKCIVINNQSLPLKILTPIILWSIWKNRNLTLFRNSTKPITHYDIIFQTLEYYHLVHKHKEKHIRETKTIRWTPPPKGFFKLNIDGSIDANTNTGGGGGLMRNNNGEWIIGFASQHHSQSAVHMELMALYNGIYWRSWAGHRWTIFLEKEMLLQPSWPAMGKAVSQKCEEI